MTVAGSMMLYQTCYATTFKKTEITTLPYLNKDYNAAGNRADWHNPTDQHTFTQSQTTSGPNEPGRKRSRPSSQRSTLSKNIELAILKFSKQKTNSCFTHLFIVPS